MTKSNLGITEEKAKELQKKFGKNELINSKKQNWFVKCLKIICEPMFLLLIVACIIYFVLGNPTDGAIMLVFVFGMILIDIVQEFKTDKTLNALKDLSAPHIIVIRDGIEKSINSCDLVPSDVIKIEEGVKIPADGFIIKANDLCIDESSLTGESAGVWKVERGNKTKKGYWKKDYVYAGTLVTLGSGYIEIDKIGSLTEYGKIGKNIAEAKETPTPLQKQTGKLVKICAGVAGVLFALVAVITYFNLGDGFSGNKLIQSILSGITLAMAMIPEEFPVILTVFLSMGAWRLAKKQSLVRKLPSVETLGAVSVLCVDKTGTLTMNQMAVSEIITMDCEEEDFYLTMGKACEMEPYDPMEKAILNFCNEKKITNNQLFTGELIKEYSFSSTTKMMGHVWKNGDKIEICAKGSYENITKICDLSPEKIQEIENRVSEMSEKGLRVIAVAKAEIANKNEIPENIYKCHLNFCGLVGLFDPPRPNMKKYIEKCQNAHIRIVMITGDNGLTASSIARQIGILNPDKIITGDMINEMNDEDLSKCVKETNIFSRVIPEHKMRIVKVFQSNGEIVAMTGDGVNDAPALKHADIGISMGKRGSEVSREAADIILLDDNFSTIVDTICDGRRIYKNIRRAIGYVFTIHIPIALSALLAPMLKIVPESLMLLPLHVVLLELVIDPTCSIILERIPAEDNIMNEPPRSPKENILKKGTLIKSIVQGLVIFAVSFSTYYLFNPFENPNLSRTMAFTILMLSNLLLLYINSSDSEYAYKSIKKLAKDKVMWIVNIVTLLMLSLIIYTPLKIVLKMSNLNVVQLLICIGLSIIATCWYEFIKLIKKAKTKL